MEVDTVPFGCYRRSVFDTLGGFEPRLFGGQDYEFNRRLRLAGGRIVLVPHITCEYLVRSSMRDFVHHRIRDGFWAVYPLRYGLTAASWRHLVPMFAVVVGGGALFVQSVLGNATLVPTLALATLLALYLVLDIVAATKIALANGDIRLWFLLLMSFPMIHLSYGIGSAWGAAVALYRCIRGGSAQHRASLEEGG